MPTELSLESEADAVSQSGSVVDGNHVSSDFNWLGLNEVICWDRVTRLGCRFSNSWSGDNHLLTAHGWVVWRRRHALSSWRWYEGAEALGSPGSMRVDQRMV